MQDEWIAKPLNSLVVGRVAGYQFQAVLQGNGRDHWVGASDELTGALQVTLDSPG
jgi:hypothetical protein